MRSKKKKIFIIYGKKDKKLIKLYFKEIVKCDIFAYISLLNT